MGILDQPLVECVPNFSEGRRKEVIDAITGEITTVEGVYLLDVDMGATTNRTVVTFAGTPEAVVEAAFRAIRKAGELIDMRQHQGAHPRMGATDVCPLVPISRISMEEVVELARKLAQRVGEELRIPVYLYENAAIHSWRKSLAVIREGEYEALPQKLGTERWKPDFGPNQWNEHTARTGATVIGARPFLIAYNINLNTRSVRRANSIAFDLRERGRILRKGHPIIGEIIRDAEGNPYHLPGIFRDVRGIGWYIEEYGIAQVSLNVLNTETCPLHRVFEEAVQSALRRGLHVTGSEIVGLVPLNVLLDAGKYFLRKQNLSWGVPVEELIHIAVQTLGLNSVQPFEPRKKVIEFVLMEKAGEKDVWNEKSLRRFLNEISLDSPVPGGGSVAALAGSLAASLGAMVANLTANRRGGEQDLPYWGEVAEHLQRYKDRLYSLIQKDAEAFDQVMEAYRSRDPQKIQNALLLAASIPLQTMETVVDALTWIQKTAEQGMASAITDAGTAAHMARASLESAYLNVRINLRELPDDLPQKQEIGRKARTLHSSGTQQIQSILRIVEKRLSA